MRRAKINRVHALRTVVYSCEFGLLFAVVLTACLGLLRWPTFSAWLDWHAHLALINGRTMPMLLGASVCALAGSYRLAAAYRLYLRLDRPLLTVLAAQAVVLLAVIVVLLRFAPVS